MVVWAFAGACSRDDGEIAPVYSFAERAASAHTRAETRGYEFTAEEHRRGLLRDGWSTPEITQEDLVSFTWTVGLEATLQFYQVSRRARWLHFQCWPYLLRTDQPQSVVVALNDVELGRVELPAGRRSYSLPVPADALTVGENTVSFRFAYAEAPQQREEGSTDTRRLAAAFDYVSLTTQADARPPDMSPTRHTATEAQLEQPVGSDVTFSLSVPQRGELEFGLEPTSTTAGAALVIRRQDADEDVLFEGSTTGWFRRTRRVDLSSFAGERVDIIFRAFPNAELGTIAWRNPRLLGDVGDTNLRSNVLLIVIDTLRADSLGSYGGTAATPNLDALAAGGVRFERAYTHIPITVPSHSSMFTSLVPSVHGVHSNFARLADAHLTLAELLRRSYRDTAAFVSLGVLKVTAGLSQGFDDYHDEFGLDWWKTAGEMTRDVLAWAEPRTTAPYFLWAHYSDPHAPYAAPATDRPQVQVEHHGEPISVLTVDATTAAMPLTAPPGRSQIRLASTGSHPLRQVRVRDPRTRDPLVELSCGDRCAADEENVFRMVLPATVIAHNRSDEDIESELLLRVEETLPLPEIRRRYLEEVEYADREIGRLLSALRAAGRLEDTLVILTSDHGEGLGDHGSVGHVSRLYEEQLRVPLILSWPGRLPAGKVVDTPVALRDLLPTVLDLLKVPDATERAGHSLVPLMAEEAGTPPPHAIVAETFEPEALRDLQAVVSDGYKLISTREDDRAELYDLSRDPGELDNQADQRAELVAEMRRVLRAELDAMVAYEPGEIEMTEEQLQRLRALGYVR